MQLKKSFIIYTMTLCGFLMCSQNAHADIFNRKNTNQNNGEVFNGRVQSTPEQEKDTKKPATKTGKPENNTPNVPAQEAGEPETMDELKALNVYPYYMGAAKYCSHEWESQICMKTLSEASLIMTSNFADDLNKNGFEGHLEELKQHCAASAAATKVNVPASAQRSAIVECVNHIVDVSEKTGLKPDPNFYQLMVGSVLCFDKNAACILIEQGLDSALAAHKSTK